MNNVLPQGSKYMVHAEQFYSPWCIKRSSETTKDTKSRIHFRIEFALYIASLNTTHAKKKSLRFTLVRAMKDTQKRLLREVNAYETD